MNKILKGIITAFLISVFFYAVFSFGAWDANPATWSKDLRVGFCIVITISFFLCVAYTSAPTEDKG